MKLYRVKLRGFTGSPYECSYAVAGNPDEAYKKVRAFLDAKDIGFWKDRELDSVQLIADTKEYPDCGTGLFL